MKITAATNGTVKNFCASGDRAEFEYKGSPVFSDFEIWVEDENGKIIDYKLLYFTKRGKLKMSTYKH